MKVSIFVAFVFMLAVITACQEEKTESKVNFKRLDLKSQGVNIVMNAPENAKVTAGNKTQEGKGLSVVMDNKFNVLIDVLEETADESHDAKLIKQREKEFQLEGGNKIILDNPQGFVYEINDEDIGTDYGFFYVMIKNNQQIEFTQGNHQENFTKEDIMKMYEAVKMSE